MTHVSDKPPPSPVWWGHRKQYRDGAVTFITRYHRLGGARQWGLSPTLDQGLSGPTDPRGLGVGRSTFVPPHPSFPHLGPSCSPTLAPLPSPETRRRGRVGSCTGPGCPSVLHAGWSTALGRSPLPKPLLRQAAGSELRGLAASKVVFVSAPALAEEQFKPTTSGKKVWHVCWLLLRPLLALLL